MILKLLYFLRKLRSIVLYLRINSLYNMNSLLEIMKNMPNYEKALSLLEKIENSPRYEKAIQKKNEEQYEIYKNIVKSICDTINSHKTHIDENGNIRLGSKPEPIMKIYFDNTKCLIKIIVTNEYPNLLDYFISKFNFSFSYVKEIKYTKVEKKPKKCSLIIDIKLITTNQYNNILPKIHCICSYIESNIDKYWTSRIDYLYFIEGFPNMYQDNYNIVNILFNEERCKEICSFIPV